MLRDAYKHRKQTILQDIEATFQKLKALENEFEARKQQSDEKMADQYRVLCQGLIKKRTRLQNERTRFEASSNGGQGKRKHSEGFKEKSIQ